jgi:hypothetical protein
MEAGNHKNPMVFHLEEYSVGKSPHTRPPPLSMHNGKSQGCSSDSLDCFFHCHDEPQAELWAFAPVPLQRLSKFCVRLW